MTVLIDTIAFFLSALFWVVLHGQPIDEAQSAEMDADGDFPR